MQEFCHAHLCLPMRAFVHVSNEKKTRMRRARRGRRNVVVVELEVEKVRKKGER